MALSSKKLIEIPIPSPSLTTTKAHQYLLPKTRRNLSFKYNSYSSTSLPSLSFFRSNSSSSSSLLSTFRCNSCRPSSSSSKKILKIEPEPIFSSVKTFAPATIADVGPPATWEGIIICDIINCAVDGIGNYVTVEIDDDVPPSHVKIKSVESEVDSLWNYDTLDPSLNSAGIAAITVMKRLGIASVGISLTLEKGLSPLGQIGCSAANAAAAAVAVNEIFGRKLSIVDLIRECRFTVSEWYKDCHIENLTTAFMGGFVLINSYERLEIVPLEFPSEKKLFFILVKPEIETQKWTTTVLKRDDYYLCSSVASQMNRPPGIHSKEREKRQPLIHDLVVMKKAAGEFGCKIFMGNMENRSAKVVAFKKGVFGCKWIGNRVIAVTDEEEEECKEIGNQMVEAFLKHGGVKASAVVHSLDRVGARVISSQPRTY
ncbi:homoserine kinase-like [Telopea speciosissima]|uniref:homoserine kinase-like n=1 Tax=Telopea speciosissima TaxID=54955 RepID=UPI001CC6E365|nr:homoserine kinase-like [Telopea speciosissima]